jgi:predicted acylesterase/phospholipase RssA
MRSLISLEVLAEIERLLQQAEGRDDSFVLADYFDYIAGSSSGSIVASCLALGMRVSDISDFFLSRGSQLFTKASIINRLKYIYDPEPFAKQLRELFGSDTTLGSERLKTLLLLVLTNATTWSPWAFTNDPRAKYNQRDRLDCNLNLPLWQLVRASTASPVYFPPEIITIGQETSVFVDGNMSVYNNPSFLLYLNATFESQSSQLSPGENDILLISIGSGGAAGAPHPEGAVSAFSNLVVFPGALMWAANIEQDLLCRVFGKCRAGDELDDRLEELIKGHQDKSNKCFTYVRYQADLSAAGLLELGLSSIDPGVVSQHDSIAHTSELQLIGKAVAKTKIKPEHFSGFLKQEGAISTRSADAKMREDLDVKIDQGEEYQGNDRWRWWVWVEGPEDNLNKIDHVIYTLDRTFPNPIREVTDRQSKFRLETAGWGTFPVKATIIRKDGVKEQLIHNLRLTYPDGTATTK